MMPTVPVPDDVTAVVVTFNSAGTIVACLETLPAGVAVIVVDNASRDDTCALVEGVRPDAVIVRNPVNEGYGRANNQGMARVTTGFGMIVNPDSLVDGTAVANLLVAAERCPEAAVVAPLLRHPGGDMELPLMGPGERNHRQAEFEPAGDFCTWFLTGAVLLFRMEAWRKIGGFDEAIFLYNEDADLALRINAAGYAQVLAPAAVASHIGGGSVPRTFRIRWLKDWHMTWSHYYFESKHGGDRAALRAAARAAALRSGLRTLLYVILLNPKRVVGNAAKASAALAFSRGRPSRAR